MDLRAPSRIRPHLTRLTICTLLIGLAMGGMWASSLGAGRARAATTTAFIRINQLGYASTAMKRAYLMASASEAGATFSVHNAGGTTGASGAIGASPGSRGAGLPQGYARGL